MRGYLYTSWRVAQEELLTGLAIPTNQCKVPLVELAGIEPASEQLISHPNYDHLLVATRNLLKKAV